MQAVCHNKNLSFKSPSVKQYVEHLAKICLVNDCTEGDEDSSNDDVGCGIFVLVTMVVLQATMLYCKTTLGREQPGLVRCILVSIRTQVQDRWLTC